MLRALETMRTKEELCDYLKLLGIKDVKKVAENLKQIYIDKENCSDVLTSKQLDQVAGGVFCEFGDGFFDKPQFSLKEGCEGSLTLKMDGKTEKFDINNIDSLAKLSQRHNYVLEKFMQWAPTQLKAIHKLPKTNKDRIFIDKFIYKHLSSKSKQLLSAKKQKTSSPNLANNQTNYKTQANKEFELEKKIVFSILIGVAYIGLSYLISKSK